MTASPGPDPHPARQFRYYDLVMAAFVTVLLCANLIGAAKVAAIGGVAFNSGVLFFPVSYIFGDVLTEVYGYARARKVVWAGFGALWPSWPRGNCFRSRLTGRPPSRASSAPPGGSCWPRWWPTSAASSATPTCSRR
jgi:hypothetical protein